MAPPNFVINKLVPMRGGPNDKKPKPAVIEITRSTSQPIDPTALSFLTTLPAEIRNAVYTLLFRQEAPIEIVDQAEQHKDPSWLEYISEASDEDEAEREGGSYATRKTHDFDQGIKLLRTCRQIYWESVGTLYSANSFCVTAPEHRHNSQFMQIQTAANFIDSIGTHFFLITKLLVDVTRVCPVECLESQWVDFLPLVRVLWLRPVAAPQVSFISGKYRLNSKLHDGSEYEDTPGMSVERMNAVLYTLCETDHLSFRRFGRFERLISLIDIYAYANSEDVVEPSEGVVENAIYYRCDPNSIEVPLVVDEIGQNRTLSLEPMRGFVTLPWHILKRIVHYVLSPCKNINFDLHKRTVTGLDRGILRLNSQCRILAYDFLRDSRYVTLSMGSSETFTSFKDFRKLREWQSMPYGSILERVGAGVPHRNETRLTPRILLHFDNPDATLLDLRIDIRCFIRLTYYMATSMVVKISVSSTKTSRRSKEAYEIGLQTLRRRCFLLLSVMLLQKPTLASLPAPEIWIDGTGTPIEVVWSGPKAGRIRRGPDYPLTAAALRAIGLDHITEIESRFVDRSWPWHGKHTKPLRYNAINTDDSLLSFWISLRTLDWVDAH